MEFQSNPYLIWQLIPGMILFGIGLYIQTRPVKKRESDVFSLLMFGGSLWAISAAIQPLTTDLLWQRAWNAVVYLGITSVPTSWFLLSVKLTGYFQARIEKIEKWLWAVPGVLYLCMITSGYHKLFFTSNEIVHVGGYASLENVFGMLFYVHTLYSYLLVLSGILILGTSLALNFKRYGVQAYGLIIGVLAPLVGNAYFLFGSPPVGFPDPTPIIFTVTGIAFVWAIFGGHMLEVVPLANEAIVQRLSTGVVILDSEKKIRSINPAAMKMANLPAQTSDSKAFSSLVAKIPVVMETILPVLDEVTNESQSLQVTIPEYNRTLQVLISRIEDERRLSLGWLIQFSDVSEKKQAEENLKSARRTFETVLDTLQDSYFEADRGGFITYANLSFVREVGNTAREEVIGKHFRHYTDPSVVRTIFTTFQTVYETGEPVPPFEFRFRKTDRVTRIGDAYVSPILDGKEVIGTRGLIRDITDRVLSEAALEAAKNQAESRAEALAAINRVATTVNMSLDMKDILQSVCQEMTSIFAIRNAGIGLITPDRGSLEIVAFHSSEPGETSALGMLLPLEGNPSSQEVIQKKKTVVIQDAQNDPRSNSIADVSRERGTKSLIIVPLLARGEVIGTIGMPARDPNHVFTDSEISLAETIASQIAAAVNNARLYEKTEHALDIAERDLEIGRQIQAGFFPEKLPAIPGWEIATQFHAARQVAGDFYDVFRFKNSSFTAFIIADVCDKGVGAALFMVLFRSLLRAFSEIEVNCENVQAQLLKIILNTNNFIAIYHGRSNMFATLFFGILDPESGILYYVNCGHEEPVILNKDGKIVERLSPTGPAVGLFPDMPFEVKQRQIDLGDILVGFTDGTTDARNTSGDSFTEERFLQNIAVPWTSAFSMLFELNVELQKHIGAQPQFDDITLISFRRKLTMERDNHAICRPANLEILPELRDFVESAARNHQLSSDDILAFKLAVDEICTNILQYGYSGRLPGLLSLFFDVDAGKARLIIRDDGNPFSPDQAQLPDIESGWEEREIGGLGIYFVKGMMDNVSYSQVAGNVNQLVLEKGVKFSK